MSAKKSISFDYKNKSQGQAKKITNVERAQELKEERATKKAIRAYLDEMPIDELGSIYHGRLNRIAIALQNEMAEMNDWRIHIQQKLIPK